MKYLKSLYDKNIKDVGDKLVVKDGVGVHIAYSCVSPEMHDQTYFVSIIPASTPTPKDTLCDLPLDYEILTYFRGSGLFFSCFLAF